MVMKYWESSIHFFFISIQITINFRLQYHYKNFQQNIFSPFVCTKADIFAITDSGYKQTWQNYIFVIIISHDLPNSCKCCHQNFQSVEKSRRMYFWVNLLLRNILLLLSNYTYLSHHTLACRTSGKHFNTFLPFQIVLIL